MPGQEYKVRITADTRQATDKIDAVQNGLEQLTERSHDIKVNIDANSVKRSVADTNEIANNLKSASNNIRVTSGTNIVSANSLASAAALASTFYSIRKDVNGLNQDLGKALGKTNVSEFMRTPEFLERVLQNSRSTSKEITETYKNIREIPGTAAVLGPVENFARSKAWEAYGSQIAGATVQAAKQGIITSVNESKKFFYGEIIDDFKASASSTIDTLARLGLAIQGVQLLIGPLASAWSAAFDLIIGQNIRLEQTLLSTQTTLASTGRVINAATGEEILDPLQKIKALEGGVRTAVNNIRIRSLDLAGVTSQQIIDIFGVVATSISQVNGNIKDAEDLSISFTAAMGTLGIPFYQARQEIGSILGGYITEDSLLAKRLQISNADIAKAKSSIDGVVGYLKKKLETAVAGQSIQAQGFAGVTSNIKEIFEVIGQRVGAPLLAPLVGGLTVVYNSLKKIQGVVSDVGEYLSKTLASTVGAIVDIFKSTKLAQSITSFFDALAAPYERMRRAAELGLGTTVPNMIEAWLNGTLKVPPALEGVVNALASFSNFLKLQVDLISEPIRQLIDQSRELADGGVGIAQRAARIASIPFGNFIELGDTFTKGWDTLTSTIQAAATALTKFGLAIIRLKIQEFTAQIRAAAAVFETFGSVVLGKLNLAISFFDFIGSALGTDFAKYIASLIAINKLISNTDFFGIKGIAIWATQTRVIFKQLIGDAKLFVQGFKDAGNIENILANTQSAYAKAFGLGVKSGNPVLENAAQIDILQQKLTSLNSLQKQMATEGADISAMARYGKEIENTITKLGEAEAAQKKFTIVQRASGAVKGFFGVSAELSQAKEAARQASVIASGAASAHILSGALDSLATKLGMSREQLNSFGGAASAAGKSLQTFLTTTALINLTFTAASLLISAGIAYWQQYEEKMRAARLESLRMAEVNKILASGWSSVIEAANGGDIASINKLDEARSSAQSALNIQLEKRNKLQEQDAELNDKIYATRQSIAQYDKISRARTDTLDLTDLDSLERAVSDYEKRRKDVAAQLLQAQRDTLKAREAIQLLDREQKAPQDFKILAERRKDLEEKIKQTREEYSKEIADKEFQSTIERLNLERQAAKERVQFEKSAITEQYNLLSANSSDQESKSIQQLSKYKVALLEAADAEAQRRSDLEQKQMQMKKAIEDYAFKMARERIRLEKELGGYQKQMEQYKNNMTDIRLQKEVNAARQREALLGINYQPANAEQQQAFINASQDPSVRMDHRKLYAYLQMIPKDQLGVTSLDEPLVAFQKLYSYLLQLKVRKGITGLEGVAEWQGLPPTIVPALLKEAERRFGTEMWSTPRNPSDVKVPNLNIDIPGYTARLESADKILLQATRDLQESQRMNDTQRVQQILNQVKDPSTLTDVRNSYASELDRGRTQVRNLTKVIGQLGNTSSFLSQKLEEAQQSARAAIRGATRELVAQGKVTESDVNYFANLITKNEGKFDQRAQLFYSKLDDTTQKYLAAIIEGMANATNQIKNNAPTAQKVDQLNQFQESLRGSFPADAGARQQPIREMFNRILDAKNPIDEMSSLEDRINRIKSQASLMIESLRAQFPEISKEFNKELTAMGENWVKNMTQVEVTLEPVRDKLRAALDPITTLFKEWQKEIKNTHAMVASLAQSVSSELSNAMSSAVTGVLEGTTTVKDAFANMFRNIAKSFIDMAMQMIAKALILKVLGIFLPGLGLSTPETTAAPILANGYPALAAANGGAFSANGIIPFASGGIVSRPTMFRFADGGAMRSGIMGEAGPEAILPLRRGADGRLGVMAGGAGGGGINVVVNVDATGSKVEGDNTQASQLGRAISAAVQSELVKQKRPGGLLA